LPVTMAEAAQPAKAEAAPAAAAAASGDDNKSQSKDKAAASGPRIPSGPFTMKDIPADYKTLDKYILDEVLCASGLEELSPIPAAEKDNAQKSKKVEWLSLGEKNGCKMWYAYTEGSANYFFKGTAEVEVPLKTLEAAIRIPENMKLMDPMCKGTKTVKTWDDEHHIYYASFKMPPMVWDRDFVWYCVDTNLRDGTYVSTGKSIVTDLCPVDAAMHVRGEIRASGYIIQPIKDKPNSCLCTYIVQTDPAGWLPTWVVNWVAQSQAYNPGVIRGKQKELGEKYGPKAGGGGSGGDKAASS